jgi:hypothetical protein
MATSCWNMPLQLFTRIPITLLYSLCEQINAGSLSLIYTSLCPVSFSDSLGMRLVSSFTDSLNSWLVSYVDDSVLSNSQ